MKSFLPIIAALVALCSFGATAADDAQLKSPASALPALLPENPSAAKVLEVCRTMLPKTALLFTGTMTVRDARGRTKEEYDFQLDLDRGKNPAAVKVQVFEAGTRDVVAEYTNEKPQTGNIAKTDVAWSDLTLEYLWWNDVAFATGRDDESVHGQKCHVIRVKPPKPIKGVGYVDLWADRRSGCMMQAEQHDESGKLARRLWGKRIKKFGERWMANVLEVETTGSGSRTKITIDSITEL